METLLDLDFESGTVGQQVTADNVRLGGTVFPGFPAPLAQYSNAQARPGGGSQSLLVQDTLFPDTDNVPEIFWNFNADASALDTTRTLKFGYWHFQAEAQEVAGTSPQPTNKAFTNDSGIMHVILTGSDANKTRPEGSNGYLAQAWNFVGLEDAEGFTAPGNYEYFGDKNPTLFPQDNPLYFQPLAQATTGNWYYIENYIPLVNQYDGSSKFTGKVDTLDADGDGDTTEFRGYVDLQPTGSDGDPNNDRAPDTNVFYSRVYDASMNVIGQTPYMFRQPSDHNEFGGTGGEFTLRALQIWHGGSDWSTQYYDDIFAGYVETGDITAVTEAVNSGSGATEFDYDGDGDVDVADRDYYIQTVLLTAYGDTNYDFQVDLTDLQTIADNFDTATSGWANGDLNGDGLVNQADVDLIGQNWHHALDGSGIVPAGPSDFEDALTAVGLMLGEVLAGDYNDNGLVEQGDLNLVLNNWGVDTGSQGVPPGWLADFPEGLVDQAELNEVLNRWGSTAAPSFAQASVPEPGAALALIGLVSLSVRRRRV